MKQLFALCICILAIQPILVNAQTEQKSELVVIVTLNDNSEIRGMLIEENDSKIVIQNDQLGLITFQKSDIKNIVRLNDKGWLPNPHPTKYFLGQSAYSLEKGDGYYQNIMAVFNSVQYGFTDKLSGGLGVELITLTTGNPILYANLKYALPINDKFRMAISGNFLTLVDEGSIGFMSGLATYGTTEHNLTLGAGYGIAGGGLTSDAVITLNGMTRIARRFSLLTENYILPGNGEAISAFGIRLINKKNTMDFLLLEGQFPLIDFVFKF
ncbi:MAG: hypothetical protein ACI9Z3_001274 [Roseivirga sp.]|jgi:hypothetical protein